MAMAMARERKAPANERGLYGRRGGVIYASEQVHMAVPKAVAMLGIGRENLHYVPCDDSYRMIPSLLEQAICQDRHKAGSRLQWLHLRHSKHRLNRSAARNPRLPAPMISGCI